MVRARVGLTNDLLSLTFREEDGTELLKNVLSYIHGQGDWYYFFIFGDSFYSYDLSAYESIYPELKKEEGFIQLKEEDTLNVQFIYCLLNQFHSCQLYISRFSNFIQLNPSATWRRSFPQLDNGYTISMLVDFMSVERKALSPDWNLSKMGIDSI